MARRFRDVLSSAVGIAALLVFGWLLSFYILPDYLKELRATVTLGLYGETVEGKVTHLSQQQKRHTGRRSHYTQLICRVGYSFATGSQAYSKEAHVLCRPWKELQEGTSIAVRYLPESPEINMPVMAKEMLKHTLATSLLVCLGTSLVCALIRILSRNKAEALKDTAYAVHDLWKAFTTEIIITVLFIEAVFQMYLMTYLSTYAWMLGALTLGMLYELYKQLQKIRIATSQHTLGQEEKLTITRRATTALLIIVLPALFFGGLNLLF